MDGWAGTWRTKRGQFIDCLFLNQNTSDMISNNVLAHNRRPDGSFSAKQTNAYTVNKLIIQGVFMTERAELVLETTDDVSKLRVNDSVEIVGREKKYIVDDIQSVEDLRSSQFLNTVQVRKYYIALRG